MHEIALRALLHDRGKFIAALAGVAFATVLVVVQLGLYMGFLESSSALIRHAGGDIWVMASGSQVLDSGEPLAAGTRTELAAHPCVTRVRGLVYGWSIVRKRGGAQESVQIAALEPSPGRAFPWSLVRGLPSDLRAPDRVAVDAFDRVKLELPAEPVGTRMEVAGREVVVAGLTLGIRSFTLQPFVFSEATFARRALGMGEDEATFWLVDVSTASCIASVVSAVKRNPSLQAFTEGEFRARTEEYWVAGSGAGAALAFSAGLGLLVGAVIVGQTLFALTKEHTRELATLKAMGASGAVLAGYVLWQAATLAVAGSALGLAFSLMVRRLVTSIGLAIIFTPATLALGIATVLCMCALASLASLRKVLALDPAEVFE